MDGDRRGLLFPERLPEFHRLPPPDGLLHAMRWFWVPEWNLDPGEESRQELLPYPACNLVVEPHGVTVVGPPTRRSERVLTGSGWAVGALLRPASVPALLPDPSTARDAEIPVSAPELHSAVVGSMRAPEAPAALRRARAVDALGHWLLERVPPGDAEGALANRLADALTDPSLVRADQLPRRLHASPSTLQRIAKRYVGLSLHSMIRRRRLQEAAERLRDDPSPTIAALASALGYADHAHFSTDFKAMLGLTPSDYRRASRERASDAHRRAEGAPGSAARGSAPSDAVGSDGGLPE